MLFRSRNARLAAFFGCATLAALTLALPQLPKGHSLLAALLVIGAGALGVFPIYHAFTQDLSAGHQGKVTGITGVAAWVLPAQAQPWFGALYDRTHSYDRGLQLCGLLPLAAGFLLLMFWKPDPETKRAAQAQTQSH